MVIEESQMAFQLNCNKIKFGGIERDPNKNSVRKQCEVRKYGFWSRRVGRRAKIERLKVERDGDEIRLKLQDGSEAC